MTRIRKTRMTRTSRATMEGAGVLLHRAFGSSGEAALFDPFLLLDDFRSDKANEYIRGFPWHPHRGIETVTYMLEGRMRHGDSMKNSGVIGPGDLQWMSAGGGIIHEEMPEQSEGRMAGFQLWVNLPRARKLSKPGYQEIQAALVPKVERPHGVSVKVLAGVVDGTAGPVRDVAAEPMYLDVSIPLGGAFELPTPLGHTVFIYVMEGSASPSPGATPLADRELALFEDGDSVKIEAGPAGCRFLLLAGKPLKEPVAWRGPIVMNTERELDQAFEDYRNGSFLDRAR